MFTPILCDYRRVATIRVSRQPLLVSLAYFLASPTSPGFAGRCTPVVALSKHQTSRGVNFVNDGAINPE